MLKYVFREDVYYKPDETGRYRIILQCVETVPGRQKKKKSETLVAFGTSKKSAREMVRLMNMGLDTRIRSVAE